MVQQSLPVSVRSTQPSVLACGAWLKNAACLLNGNDAHWSAMHGDLDDPANCIALEHSVSELLTRSAGGLDAIAHDLHPDFFSTHLALRLAEQIGVPAIAVQHHHAHIGVVMAEQGLQGAVIGLALDGVGLGTDGVAWGGELLWIDKAEWRRVGHLQALPLPGGDIAAREPWRMAAAGLHVLGRSDEITRRFSGVVGQVAVRTIHTMLERQINCPPTTSAGRWFDAAAGALGLSVKQKMEAEAAIALEKMATCYLHEHGDLRSSDEYVLCDDGTLDLRPLLSKLFALADSHEPIALARGAALFHLNLVSALTKWLEWAARSCDTHVIVLGGGCFFNRILLQRLELELGRRGLKVYFPQTVSCGDAGLALGQAWVAQQHMMIR